ncbi:MAG: serine/threonine-protein kinase [Polyangiales bacterium]
MPTTAQISDPAAPDGDPRRARAEALVGASLAGRYRLLRVVGAGATGAVFEAADGDARVAVKVMLVEDVDGTLAERFLREARLAARVAHPNVVAVREVARDRATGAPFLVAEFLEGHDLRAELDARGRLDVREALGTLRPVAAALAAAHARGVVHRDVKPENIFLARGADGASSPKLIDFGLSKVLDDVAPALTQTGARLGTPRYMAPELVRGEGAATPAVDVWSFGVVLHEALTGAPLFRAANYNALMFEVLGAPVARLDAAAPGTPAWLADVAADALARDPARRIPDGAALLAALRAG